NSALLLLPLAGQGPWQGWPQFAVLVLQPVVAFVLERFRDRELTLRWKVSERLSDLANRMAAEFKNEVRARITALHHWQEEAVAAAARRQADQLIRVI